MLAASTPVMTLRSVVGFVPASPASRVARSLQLLASCAPWSSRAARLTRKLAIPWLSTAARHARHDNDPCLQTCPTRQVAKHLPLPRCLRHTAGVEKRTAEGTTASCSH